jgi:hypothetical protein
VDTRDSRRGKKRPTSPSESVQSPVPSPEEFQRLVLAKLDVVIDGQHELRRLVHRMTVVTETIRIAEVARRLSRSTRTVESLVARRVFTDARPPDNRVQGADLVFYADEIEVYRTDGVRGVERLRKELGRLAS